MIPELRELVQATPPDAPREEFRRLVVEENLLHKPTISGRKIALRRIREIYSLDHSLVLWRLFRRYLVRDPDAFPLMALLLGLAREPLLRATLPVILDMTPGNELRRDELRQSLVREAEGRLNPSIAEKVARNAAASWTQAGLLQGRTFKRRVKLEANPTAMAYALFLGYAQGNRGANLFRTPWVQVLDQDPNSLPTLAMDSRRHGLLHMHQDGDVIEIGFDGILEEVERRRIHGDIG